MIENNELRRIALFIDADNLLIGAGKASFPVDMTRILTTIREDGVVTLARAYADWSIYPARDYIPTMRQDGIEMIMLPSDSRHKNTADIQMVVDALEITILPNSPDIIALVAGDRDFVPVIQRVKRYGKTVIGMGLRGSTNRVLEAVCTKFIYYDDLFPRESEVSMEEGASLNSESASISNIQPKKIFEAYRLLIQAAKSLQRKDNEPSGARLGMMMRQLDPTFDYVQIGYNSFKGFVNAAVSLGYLELIPCNENYLDFSIRILKEPVAVTGNITANKLEFDGKDAILHSYRLILENKRIPIMTWKEREILISRLHDRMSNVSAMMEKWEIEEYLEEISDENNLQLPWNAISKLVLTLWIARVLQPDSAVDDQFSNYLDRTTKVRFLYNLPDAFLRIHTTYLKGITLSSPDAPLDRNAIALLLYGSEDAVALDNADQVIYMCKKYNPMPPKPDGWLRPRSKISQTELLASFFEIYFSKMQFSSMGKINSEYRKMMANLGAYSQASDVNALFQRCVENQILNLGKDGVTVVYTLNPDWKNLLQNL